jgi:hypothetical protein
MTQKQKSYEIEPAPPTTALAIPTAATRELTPAIWRMIGDMAPVMYQSHMFGVTSQAQAAAIMLKGYECGLSMTASFDFVKVILGKPELIPRGALALIHGSALIKRIEIKRLVDGKGAFAGYSCTMERVNGFEYTSQWTMEDAKRAGLIKDGSGWMNYPENMCLWRSVGFAADVVAPDVTAGMTTLMKAPEMYGVALTEGGDVIDATPVPTPSVTPLNQLLTEYPADAIMAANDGKIPMNDDEVALVRAKLQSA